MRRAGFVISVAAAVTGCSTLIEPDVQSLAPGARAAYRQLSSDKPHERCGAAMQLSDIQPVEDRTVRRLVQLLEDDETYPVEYFNGHGGEEAPSGCAEFALQTIGWTAVPRVLPLLRHPSPTMRMRAIRVLGPQSNDPRAARPLLATFRDPDPEVRREAFVRIDAANPLFFDEYVRSLNDHDIYIRLAANRALGENTHPKVIEVLLRNMKSDDPLIRTHAAAALVKYKDPRVLPALLNALADDSDHVRSTAVRALGNLKDPGAVEPLLSRVPETADIRMRLELISALGEIGDTRAYETLLSCLRSEDFFTRKVGVESLQRLGDPRAVEPIRPLLNDAEQVVRIVAKNALEVLGAGTTQ